MNTSKTIAILGIRGIPARHGGFETFAEHLALFLVAKGWEVTIYCQTDSDASLIHEDQWCGVKQVIIPVSVPGAKATMSPAVSATVRNRTY